jgi:two-component system nitrate/nitrite response regulator NarL
MSDTNAFEYRLQRPPKSVRSVPRRVRAKVDLVLADCHPIVLRGMQHLFDDEPDLDVVACCTNEEETLQAVLNHEPAVLVLDLHLPPSGGLALVRQLGALSTRVVLLAASISENEMLEALRLGVKGSVLKEMAPRLLVECIRQVHRGGTWYENASIASVVEGLTRRETRAHQLRQALTRREAQVLQLVAAGLHNAEITARLEIAEGTVKIHLHHIYEKLGIKDRLQLVLCARARGLV